MTPKPIPLLAQLGLLICAALILAPSSDAETGRPNVVWIVADDMSPDMGCYGDAYARTPNLDRLAAQGIRYTHAFSVNAQCAPSRSALITGMFPTTIGTHHMRSQGLPPAYVKCFTEYMRLAGYYCTNTGKTDYNLGTGSGSNSGIVLAPLGAWDENGPDAHWRGRPSEGQPFFSVFNLSTTHESRLHFPPERFESIVKDVDPAHRHDPAEAVLPAYYPDNPVFRSDWAKYHDTVTAMDLLAGKLLDDLERDGLAENTVVFFFGDHGRPLPRAKRWLYDSGIQVPLIVRWPGEVSPGAVSDEMISFVDFAPTVMSVAGVPIPGPIQGRAFLGRARLPAPEYIFAQRDRTDQLEDLIRAVRDKRYTYIRNYHPEISYATPIEYMDRMPSMKEWRRLHSEGTLEGAPAVFFRDEKFAEELYDAQSDPDSVVNLADSPEHRDVLRRMRGALADWIAETKDLGFVPEEELLERWRPGGVWSVTATPEAAPAGPFNESIDVRLSCTTPGSSIVYTTDSGADAYWRLYTGPIEIQESTTIRARAGRLGFRDSAEVTFRYVLR